MQIKFWGTRGSYPRFGKNDNTRYVSQHTPCVELLSANGETLIIDAGTGFDLAARTHFAANPTRPLNLLLSHFHWDHLTGFFMIYDLYVKGLRINIFSPFEKTEKIIHEIFKEPFCPIDPKVMQKVFHFKTLKSEDQVEGWEVQPVRLPHLGETYGFCVQRENRKVFHASDFSIAQSQDADYKKFQGPDLLICDSFHVNGDREVLGAIGHSSASEAAHFALQLQAKKLALFHYSPKYGDREIEQVLAEACKVFPNSILSTDQKVVEL